MIEICALASGSNGNCYYIGNKQDAILIDAGINCKQILIRMRLKGLDPGKLRGIFITHEHSDHVCGVRVLAKKLDIPAFMTKGTFDALYYIYKPLAIRFVEPGISVSIGPFMVHPVLKNHDAAHPTSFRIEHSGINVGVFTDIGTPCENVTSHLKQCHVLFLETNYDEKMLWEGNYPYPLKKRVSSDVGHLSNDQAVQLLTEHAGPDLKLVLLSHLSANNNTPLKAWDAMKHFEDRFEVRLTSRYEPGDVLKIEL